jgi:hypothetical protein
MVDSERSLGEPQQRVAGRLPAAAPGAASSRASVGGGDMPRDVDSAGGGEGTRPAVPSSCPRCDAGDHTRGPREDGLRHRATGRDVVHRPARGVAERERPATAPPASSRTVAATATWSASLAQSSSARPARARSAATSSTARSSAGRTGSCVAGARSSTDRAPLAGPCGQRRRWWRRPPTRLDLGGLEPRLPLQRPISIPEIPAGEVGHGTGRLMAHGVRQQLLDQSGTAFKPPPTDTA